VNYVDFPALRPIRDLLVDPNISEIMINGTGRLFVERSGKMEALRPVFQMQQQLDAMVEALLGLTGRAVTTLTPFVDFRLPDGSRVNVAVRPIAVDGPIVTIRRQSRGLGRLEDLVERNALTTPMADFLRACVAARLNILFSGGTGSGKTTLLALLSRYIPHDERIVVIEDTSELVLTQPNVVRLECRPPNIEGSGAIKLADLLKNSLRMRPTRIILGEVRGDEAFDLLSAMSSGHDGGFAVLHASTPADAVSRLAMMVLGRGLPFPLWAIQNQIASAIDIVVQHAQLSDGTRRITHITSVEAARDGEVVLKDVFTFEQRGTTKQGIVDGHFVRGADDPVCMPQLRRVAPELVTSKMDRTLRSTGSRRPKNDPLSLTQRIKPEKT
jgi:pilus assembly protein CpaF